MHRLHVVYSGKVQGVGFRATARSIARKHPVTGWVRNLPDGTVEMEVQGERTAVDACLADVRSRMAAFIKGEDARDGAIESDEAEFEIRR